MPDNHRKTSGTDRQVPPDDLDPNERPTVSPPFDLEAFAREASSPSDQPRSASDAPTNRPPPSDEMALRDFGPEAETARTNLIGEVDRETPHADYVAKPQRAGTSSVLSIANAQFPSSPNVAAVEPIERAGLPGEPAASFEPEFLDVAGDSAPPEITERTIENPVAEMRERFSLGDYTGALEMAELILAAEPDHADAAECGENCRSVLENMYAARLGPLDRVPTVLVPRAQMRWLSMDHRAGFVLSLIDGSSSVDMILDVSGMPKLDALRILHELVQQKIVSFR